MIRSLYGTTFLFFVISLMYVFELATGLAADDLMLLHFGGLSDNGQLHGQVWRLVTYAFLHANPLHLLLNGLLLLMAAPGVERRVGGLMLLAVFLTGSVLGGLALLAKGAIWPSLGTNVGATAGMISLVIARLIIARRPVPLQQDRQR